MYELYNCHYRGTHTHLVVFNQPIFPELIQDKPVPKSKRLGQMPFLSDSVKALKDDGVSD